MTKDRAYFSRTVQLGTGGTLTLSASFDAMELSSRDRRFVFDLFSDLNTYEEILVQAAEARREGEQESE